MKRKLKVMAIGALGACLGLAACESNYSESKGDPQVQRDRRDTFHDEVQVTVKAFKDKDPSLSNFFDHAYGYVVFPSIGKGGAGIGGAYGKGEVYENGKLVGTATLTQATIGAQLGGQAYSEVIFFQTQAKLDELKTGHTEFAAQASAVAATAGAAANSDYSSGVAVFTLARGGLMGEASVGGQKFSYDPSGRHMNR